MGFTGQAGGPKWFKNRFFIVIFLSVFQDGCGKRFSCIFCVLRCIGRLSFDHLFEKMWTFIKKCRHTFFAYSTAFWLDFQGFGASEIEKKREQSSLRNHGFLRDQKSASKSVFIDSGVIFGLHFGAPERPKIEEFRISSCFCVRRAFWVVLGGSILEPFWGHLERMFGVFS